jgi:hypothetical protein
LPSSVCTAIHLQYCLHTQLRNRVTRWVSQKIAQSVAQTVSSPNLLASFSAKKSCPK